MSGDHPFDEIVDVVVVGSGCAALVAATMAADGGAEVLILEKAALLGGTSAVSGGGIWLPGNDHMAAAGRPDTPDAALAYIRRLTMGHEPDPELLEVFVATAPEALRYLEANTPLEVHITPLPDYYLAWDVPGTVAVPARAVEANPYAVGDELPEWKDRIVSRGTLMSLGAATTLSEDMSAMTAELAAELKRREERDIRPKGAALIARLFKGLLERGVETRLETGVEQLIIDNDDVVGVHAGGRRIGARRGVVMACGGFEWNAELVRTHIGYDVFPLSPPNNTGAALRMAQQAGAALGNMTSYWGTPAMFDPEITRNGEPVPQFEWGRGAPSSIVVNRHGKRFANEALPYNDFPKAMGRFDPESISFPNLEAWLIFDQRVRRKQRILSMMPDGPTPPWVAEAATVGDLAELVGIDRLGLETTVEEWNRHAAERLDPAFGRHRLGLMGPGLMAPLTAAPYFAVPIHPGMLGTNGGARINRHGQVIRPTGEAIPGLYAAGNSAANVFGWAYPSGGGTLGNGLVFGFLAGRHVGQQPARFSG